MAILDSGVYAEHTDLQCSACYLPLVKDAGNFVRDRPGGMYFEQPAIVFRNVNVFMCSISLAVRDIHFSVCRLYP